MSKSNPLESIYQVILFHARNSPERAAVLAPAREPLSYLGLLNQVERICGQLRAAGIAKEDRVAVVLPNGPEMAVAFLGVAACAVCAPLNPKYRYEDFLYYLRDLHAKAVLVGSGVSSPVREAAGELGVEVFEIVLQNQAGEFNILGISSEPRAGGEFNHKKDIALLLHTSGTTSRPKIVPLAHENLCASAANISRTLKLTITDRCLNVMPLFHIHGLVGALLSTSYAGASIVCTPGFEAQDFYKWMADYKPTWYSAVPTIHQAVLQAAEGHAQVIQQNPMRFIRSSSASLPPVVMRELEDAFACPVIESYGMTEAAHQMASNPLPPGKRKPGSVGLPAGPEMAVMDANGNLLSRGEVGEVVIRGRNVMRGYENNPEANAKAFTNGWFRTGDEGYFDDDGYLFLTGRLKEMINRGGEKVTPREVDEVFLMHPQVAQAVAFALPHKTLGEDLAVAVVLKEGVKVSPEELRGFAFERLPGFKVPSQVLLVNEIPKGATGKLQRIGLHERLTEYLIPETVDAESQIEIVIIRIWKEILKREDFGVLHNFFGLGGDSLMAMQVSNRISQLFEISPASDALFRYPTVKDLARYVEELLIEDIQKTS